MRNIELYILSIISGKKRGVAPFFIKLLLVFFSFFYGIAIFLRNLAYDLGIFKQTKVDAKVISIGNIVAGGTGKTQVAMAIAKKLKQKVAILTRGYRSKSSKSKIVRADSNPEICGDEACMMARNLPEVLVVAGKNRINSAKLAIENGAEVILLDDGMQHRQIARDFEIVVMDGQNPFGFGHLLPWGLLRENLFGLKRADLIVFTNGKKIDLSRYTKAEITTSRVVPVGFFDSSGRKVEVEKGEAIGAFCGIGNPDNFYEMLLSQGLKISDRLTLPDHVAISGKQLSNFSKKCQKKGAKYIICTEKDMIKIPSHNLNLPILYFKIDLEIASLSLFLSVN